MTMSICEPKCIFTWHIRRESEPHFDGDPEVSESVRKLFQQGSSGVKTVLLENESDPVVIVWEQSVNGDTSGYSTEEGYDFDTVMNGVKVSTGVKMTMTETVDQITYNNGVIEIFTEKDSAFNLVAKKLYRIR